MSLRPLLFEDLLGNISELERDIHTAASTRNWDPDWSVKINHSESPEELASISINITINARLFERDLIIFKTHRQPLSNNNNKPTKGFTIQWGFVPHPVIPIIYEWLKKVDTSAERTLKRTNQIKLELIETIWHPSNYNKHQEGI